MSSDAADPPGILPTDDAARRSDILVDWTVEVVSSFVGNNSILASDLPGLLETTYLSLQKLGGGSGPLPAAAVLESVHDEYLVCLEDGKKLKTLRRHLRQAFDLSPEEYRRKWHLPDDYPMVAPSYSRARAEIGRRAGKRTGTDQASL